MLGQLNLFTFKPKVKLYRYTSIELNQALWSIVKKTDHRGYSFGSFDDFYDSKGEKTTTNISCAVVVIYHQCKPIGFCTISYLPSSQHSYNRVPYLDVWVMPYYRDLGFGSLLVNRANRECVKITGKMPDGSDKHHSHNWDARFRRDREKEPYSYFPSVPDYQMSLFSPDMMKILSCNRARRLLTTLATSNLDHTLLKVCYDYIGKLK